MQVALIHGGAQTAKSTIGEGVRDFLQETGGLRVAYADTGVYQRRITDAVQRKLGVTGLEAKLPPENAIDDVVSQVLDVDTAEDFDLDQCPDSYGIDAWMPTISSRPDVMAATTRWCEQIAQNGLCHPENPAGLFLVAGWHPRAILASWLGRNATVPIVELWTKCQPRIATSRRLEALEEVTTDGAVKQMRQLIIERRRVETSRTRPQPVPVGPALNFVYRMHDYFPSYIEDNAEQIVQKSLETDARPPINFDTTHLSIEVARRAASCIVAKAYVLSR